MALYWEGAHTNGWPSHKDEKFWEACAKAIVDATDLPKRAGKESVFFSKYVIHGFVIFFI